MVECERECVIQWDGHAKYVMERFSGLLARQSLVDVTLICEDQKLRVHKLVLASCSLYFEEMLEQDLGQEPIILLNDLNFDVLKAMVEFMYCGETTIAYQRLESLLEAAKVFQVKELACIAEATMRPEGNMEDHIKNNRESLEKDVHGSEFIKRSFDDSECIQVRVHKKLANNKCLPLDSNGNRDVDSDRNRSLQNNVTDIDIGNELKHTFYEKSCNVGKSKSDNMGLCSSPQRRNETLTLSSDVKVEQTSKMYTYNDKSIKRINSDCLTNCSDNQELQPILYEQCCDFSNNETFSKDDMQISMPLLSCPKRTDENFTQYSSDLKDIPNKVTKCLKVYTHKRRKSVEKIKNRPICITDVMPKLAATDSIDLLDEPSGKNAPVTTLSSLEMESSEYVLNSENLESMVDCMTNESNLQVGDNETMRQSMRIDGKLDSEYHIATNHKDVRQIKELFSISNEILTIERSNANNCKTNLFTTPVLRRSVRLNQQENDDTVNNNNLSLQTQKEKDAVMISKKNHSGDTPESLTKLKRKIKESTHLSEYRVSDENAHATAKFTTKNSTNPRVLRSTSKLVARNCNKARFSLGRVNKVDQKSKTNNDLKYDKLKKLEMFHTPMCQLPIKPNTIASVNRALWGDMSDYLESREDDAELPEYSPSKEIPFALGLLPLRAALERMQAIPDYQPRKTRSSVAPLKQELNGVKRKNPISNVDSPSCTKKQSNTNSANNESNDDATNIQVGTTFPQLSRSRKRLFPEQEPIVESATLTSRQ